jgi:hypothetical protein
MASKGHLCGFQRGDAAWKTLARLFNADTATDAQKLGDEGDFVSGFDFYA